MGIGVKRLGGVLTSSLVAKVRPAKFPENAGDLPRLTCEVGVSRAMWEGFREFFADLGDGGGSGSGSGVGSGVGAGAGGGSGFSEIDDDELASRPVPPSLLHALCFPSTLDLLINRKLPIQPLGVVVTDLRWTLLRPVHPREPLELAAQVLRLSRDEAGVSFVVECVLRRDGRICYREQTRYLDKGRGGATQSVQADDSATLVAGAFGTDAGWLPLAPRHREAFGVNGAGRLDIGQRVALATMRATPGDARSWADFSGDANPIHLSAATARVFGYKNVVLHGAAIDAWAAEVVGITGDSPCNGAVSFRAPALLPSQLELIDMGGENYAVVEKRSGRDLVHLAYSGAGARGIGDGGPDAGLIVLPRQDGRASSTVVSQGMCAGAAAGFPRVRNAIEEATPWRKQYRRAMEELSRVDAPARGYRSARDGLATLYSLLHFADGRTLAKAEIRAPSSSGGVIMGSGYAGQRIAGGEAAGGEDAGREGASRDDTGENCLTVELAGRKLSGDALVSQLRDWELARVLQPAAAEALIEVASKPELLDLDGLTFVCIGAGAELSPAPQLLEWGADVAAVMRPGTERADKLQRVAAESAGRLYVAPDDACDVVREPERVAGWVADLPGRLVVVETLYAPGADFLLAAAGADVIERLVSAARPDSMLAWIGTPTDAFVLDGVAVNETLAAGRWGKLVAQYAKAARVRPGRVDGVYPGFVDVQGPNYAAAKRIGRWRATITRAAGRQASYNVGPMSLTRSVLDTAVLRAAYGGLEKLGMPAFSADASARLMAALLVWDVKHPDAVRGSDTFLTDKAVDSGLFASPYEPNGLMGVAVALGAKAGLGK
ncbi:MAG: MaoC/PaaZ C-terminal domain-containing protein [Ancrocorticia sp.]